MVTMIDRMWKIMKKMVAVFVLAMATVLFMTGCDEVDGYVDDEFEIYEPTENELDEYDFTIDEEHTNDLDDDYDEDYSFFGVWVLEQVITIYHLGRDRQISGRPSAIIHTPVADLIGYEIEFAADFVRLGNHTLPAPTYYIVEHTGISYRYGESSPLSSERINELMKITADMWNNREGNSYVSWALQAIRSQFVSIRYYPEKRYLPGPFYGFILLDPVMYDYHIPLNPLMEGFRMIHENYIIFTFETSGRTLERIIARRVG